VLLDTFHNFESATLNLSFSISYHSVTARSYLVWMKELTKLDQKLCSFLISLTCLHVARNISIHGFSDRWTELLSILCDDLGCDKKFDQQQENARIG